MSERKKHVIYIPTFNNGRFIKRTLQSLMDQKNKKFDIIVFDNASEDETEDIVRGFNSNRIIYYKNPKNIGSSLNFISCINHAKVSEYDYMSIFHSDDIYLDTIVDLQVDFLDKFYQVGSVFTRMQTINVEDKVIKNYYYSKEDIIIFATGTLLKYVFENGTPLICPSFTCRVSMLKDIGIPDIKYPFFGDTEFYIRFNQKFATGIINRPLVQYRISEKQGSSIQRQNIVTLSEEHQYFERIKENFNFDSRTKYFKRRAIEYLIYSLNEQHSGTNKDINFLQISIESWKFGLLNPYGLIQYSLKFRSHFISNLILLMYRVFSSLTSLVALIKNKMKSKNKINFDNVSLIK